MLVRLSITFDLTSARMYERVFIRRFLVVDIVAYLKQTAKPLDSEFQQVQVYRTPLKAKPGGRQEELVLLEFIDTVHECHGLPITSSEIVGDGSTQCRRYCQDGTSAGSNLGEFV